MVGREVRPYFESQLEFVLGELIYEGVNSEGGLVVSIDPVIHDEKLSIWRVNAEGFHGFKVPHIHTLMEVAIIKYD